MEFLIISYRLAHRHISLIKSIILSYRMEIMEHNDLIIMMTGAFVVGIVVAAIVIIMAICTHTTQIIIFIDRYCLFNR